MTSTETRSSSPDVVGIQNALVVLYPFWEDYPDKFVECRAIGDGTPKLFSMSTKYGTREVADRIVQWIDMEGLHGTHSIYVGRALRDTEQVGSTANISVVQSITLDIDPIRADMKRPSNGDELMAAMRQANLVGYELFTKYGSGYNSIMTGSGYQIWIPLLRPVDVRGRKRWWESGQRTFEELQRSNMRQDGTAKMDVQWDLARIVKLPGTLAIRGMSTPDRPHRMAICTVGGSLVGLNPDRIFELCPNEMEGKYEALSLKPAAHIPERFWVAIARYPRLREAWLGKRNDLKDGSPSGQDMALCNGLRATGFSPEEALTILTEAPGGSPEKRSRKDYLTLTVQKAYNV